MKNVNLWKIWFQMFYEILYHWNQYAFPRNFMKRLTFSTMQKDYRTKQSWSFIFDGVYDVDSEWVIF